MSTGQQPMITVIVSKKQDKIIKTYIKKSISVWSDKTEILPVEGVYKPDSF